LTEKEKLLSISFLWNWWSERNRGNHGERYQYIDQFQYTVRRHVNEWETYLKKKNEQKHPLNCHWTTPPLDTVKINTDASFQESTRSGGWGVDGIKGGALKGQKGEPSRSNSQTNH
jgi:hypothetical protein